tara:strand:- start:1573 stop:2442 length:870 start_codon:yes stop_codon:yes gene_type:complete
MKMRLLLISICFLGIISQADSQSNFEGTWQGSITKNGRTIDQSNLIYFEFNIEAGKLTGYSREEIDESKLFAVKSINGSVKENTLSFRQTVIIKYKKSGSLRWCKLLGELSYDSLTGYLTGKYTSSDCRRGTGTIKLYKAEFELSKEKEAKTSQLWFSQYTSDVKDGLNAPLIRQVERENFKFEPVFFDFDKHDIRSEHKTFLDGLIKIVKGHSDLRVIVTGHTDSDGTDSYNDGLSKRRAQAIIDYFVLNGLSADRLDFDFKGELMPVDTNNTSEGKQRNRRVDFRFL